MKRCFALMLATILTFSSVIYAQSSDDKGLADAIEAAKNYITVPEGRTDIDYSIREGENGNTIINLSWSDDKGDTYVSLDKDGCLLSYNEYLYEEEEKKGLANYTTEQTQKKAEEFLKVVYGNNASMLRLDNKSTSRNSHYFSYRLYMNNIPVSNARASVSVDPDTGKVTSFEGVGKEFAELKYPSPQGIIDSNKAMRLFFDNKAPEPEYYTYTQYKDREITKNAFLAFSVNNTHKAVNAFTGELTEVYYYFNTINAKSGAESEDATATEYANSSGAGFTPEELKAIKEATGLITKERAEEIIKGFFPVAKNINYKTSDISKNSYNEKYFINIDGDNSHATLDAKTGKVISFSYYENNYDKDAEPVSNEEAKNTALKLAEELAPEDLKRTAEPELNSDRYSVRSYNGMSYVTMSRVENGYKCNNQQLLFTINSEGLVTSYRNNFDDKLEFPQPKNVLESDNAISALEKAFDFDLTYSVDESYNVELVYCFEDGGLMDSSSQTRLDYRGKPVETVDEIGISDVKGHWCETYVTTLFNNGYQINDSMFRPDQPITKGELDSFYNNYSIKPYYIDYEDNEEELKKTLTRYELAEYIMSYYNLDKLKAYPDMFAPIDFNDEIKKDYVPAVAMVTGMGILGGDNENNFNGEKTVTRAEAAVALYNMLTSD